MSPATENLSLLLRRAQQWQLGRAGNRDNQMEGSWQGLFFTHDSWALLFPQALLETFLWPWHKESTEQICDLAQGSVTWQWQGHMQFEKAYSAWQYDFTFSKKPSSSVESRPGGQGRGKKEAWLVSCGFVFKSWEAAINIDLINANDLTIQCNVTWGNILCNPDFF